MLCLRIGKAYFTLPEYREIGRLILMCYQNAHQGWHPLFVDEFRTEWGQIIPHPWRSAFIRRPATWASLTAWKSVSPLMKAETETMPWLYRRILSKTTNTTWLKITSTKFVFKQRSVHIWDCKDTKTRSCHFHHKEMKVDLMGFVVSPQLFGGFYNLERPFQYIF